MQESDIFERLLAHLRSCTVRIEIGACRGTGFFVGPRILLTAAHVLRDGLRESASTPIEAHWVHDTETPPLTLSRLHKDAPLNPALDLAFLQLDRDDIKHPYVHLFPLVRTREALASFGYWEGCSNGDTLLFEYEGKSFHDKRGTMLRVSGNMAPPGMSGAPLLNRRTRGVCGVIIISGKQHVRGVSIANAIEVWPELLTWQHGVADSEDVWVSFLPKTICRQRAAEYREGLIRDDLDGRDVGMSPLAEYWEEFINCEPWSGFIADLVNKSKTLSASSIPLKSIYARLSKIETKGSHNAILASLRKANIESMYAEVANIRNDLIAQYEACKQKPRTLVPSRVTSHDCDSDTATLDIRALTELSWLVARLLEEFNTPTFQNLFLVCGSLGSGKTHFIASLCVRYPLGLSKPYIPVFPDVRQLRACAAEQWLLPEICRATASDWGDIEEFDEYLCAQHPPVQVVVVIDNVDDHLGDNTFRENLKRTIEELSEFSSIRWVLTADYLSLGKVSRSMPEHYWKKRAYVGSRRASLGNTLGWRSDQPSTHESIDGWYLLDELNRSKEVGKSIIANAVHGQKLLEDLEFAEPATVAQISNPLVAWAVADVSTKLSVPAIVNLRYIELLEQFWREKIRRISCLEAYPQVDDKLLHECVALLSHLLVDGAISTLDSKASVLQKICNSSEGGSDLNVRAVASQAIEALAKANLVKSEPAEAEPSVMLLRFECGLFWPWQCANVVFKEFLRSGYRIDVVKAGLSRFPKESDFRRGAQEFIFLLMDSNNDQRVQKLLGSYWIGCLTGKDGVASAAWFAGAKFRNDSQNSLVRHMRESATRIESSIRLDIFSYMYFLNEVIPSALEMPDRLHLLQPFQAVIANYALSEYYVYIAKRVVRRVVDIESLSRCIVYMSGCEEMKIADRLAKISADRLKALTSNCKHLIEANIALIKRISQKSFRQEGSKSGSRRSYAQWFLYEICNYIVSQRGLAAFTLLKSEGWFLSAAAGIKYPYSLWMRQEANLALGYWYRSSAKPQEKKSYVELIYNLIKTGEEEDRETAFYLIRHSKPTHSSQSVRVNSIFNQALIELFNDRRLERLIETNREFFNYNLRDPV